MGSRETKAEKTETDKTETENRQAGALSPLGPPVEEVLFGYLRDVVKNPATAALDVEKLPENFQKLGKGLQYVVQCLAETTVLAKSLSQGDLNGPWPSKGNDIAAPLKGLHATLKHLTWQTQQVAKGDYNQRVSFMGDFSNAFNAMVEELNEKRKALLDEIEKSHKKTLALAQNNEFFESVTAQISQWIVVIDKASGEWIYANHDPGEILASSARQKRLLEIWMKDKAAKYVYEADKDAMDLDLPNGQERQFFSVTAHPLHWHEKEALAFVFTDVSSDKARLLKLEEIAYRDTLTKAYNRHFGMKVLEEWLTDRSRFVICFVDMDNLKFVNDKFGHSEGDNYILRVTELLREFSEGVVVCRLGGDEFMLLAQEWEASAAEAHMERLRDCLIAYNDKPEAFYIHSMSYGVIGVDEFNSLSSSELLGMADEKMYNYKKAHKRQRETTTELITVKTLA
jgi:diguanylate cyclase (GGDEF)-like protein